MVIRSCLADQRALLLSLVMLIEESMVVMVIKGPVNFGILYLYLFGFSFMVSS